MSLPSLLKDSKQALTLANSRAMFGVKGAQHLTVSGFSVLAQYQILDQWCWNAVGSAISAYHLGADVGENEIQSSNAAKYIADTNGRCALIDIPGHGKIKEWIPYIKGASPIHYKAGRTPCNKAHWPQLVTNGTEKLQSSWIWHSAGPSDSEIEKVIDEIRLGNPVVMYINWGPGRGAHVVTVYGSYMQGKTRMFNLADPYYGLETTKGAPDGGTWAGSMFTKVI